MKLLFLPAIRVLDRLSYPLKFGLIILVCAAASAILLTQIFTNLRGEIRVTEQEIAGLELFDAGFAVILKTQQHRGLSAGVLGGSADLVPKREQKAQELTAAMTALDAAIARETNWAPLQPGWQRVRSTLVSLADDGLRLDGPTNFRTHTEAIAGMLRWLQTWLAVPLILAFGLLQIDWHDAWLGYSAWQFAALLLLPIISKLAGNWLGLSWAAGQLRAYAGQWRESLLLNTRGLTEIIFLNLLLQQQIISPALYFALMLMGLISTLLPALAGAYPHAATHEARSRYEVS